ncbi:hypothetical protein GCM10025759_11600 [Lysobacter panacisoli]|uniref:Uncharacterized protein n=1 Tax=Lysobacter panacisoli TaxID=1255263 RepID=A0ABP9LA12_9GAMM
MVRAQNLEQPVTDFRNVPKDRGQQPQRHRGQREPAQHAAEPRESLEQLFYQDIDGHEQSPRAAAEGKPTLGNDFGTLGRSPFAGWRGAREAQPPGTFTPAWGRPERVRYHRRDSIRTVR